MYFQVKFVNRTEQNRTEQNRTEQNRTEQNPYRASFGRRTERVSLSKSNKADCRTDIFRISLPTSFRTEQLQDLFRLQIRNKILSLIILKFFMQFSKFLNAHPSGHKARGYAFLSLSNTGFDFRTTPLLFNFKIKKIFFALLSFFILFTISCGNENKTKNEIYERNISYYAGDWINSDTKEKIFIINSDGSIIVNGENILPKSIKKNSETNYTFKVMPEWINKSSYTFNINFINDAKGKVNIGNLYFEINKIN